MVKKILLGLVVVVVILQFIRPDKNLGPAAGPHDLVTVHPATPEVANILQTACYDCHSNRTRYPWYAEIQPAGWLLASHIKDGKRHFNLSEFTGYPPERAGRKLLQAIELVQEKDMPMASYTLIHRDARLTDAQRKVLTDYFASLQPLYPTGQNKRAEAAK